MNPHPPTRRPFQSAALACSLLGLVAPSALATFSIDGIRNTANETYEEKCVQATETGWGSNNTLANLHSAQDGSSLVLHIGGRADRDEFGANSILLFIDSKAGGVSFISNNLITSGGEEETINNLGLSTSQGMTFETGFTPDYAIRIEGDGNAAHVNRYDLQAGTRNDVGDSGTTNLSDGFINDIRTSWQSANLPYAGVVHGVEMSLNLNLLGTPTGAHTVKVMAILVDEFSSYGSNQVLNSRTAPTEDIAENLNTTNFNTVTGVQTVEISVNYSGTDSDEDGIPDAYETNDGIYVSPTQTGSNPLEKDSDGDGHWDGDEVDASALGYLSNPNIPNYTDIAVPGSFNLPSAWQTVAASNSPSTAMSQASTDLTGQYQWQLDYRFVASQLGIISYKFTSGGSFDIQWGLGDTPGSVKRDGNNLQATLQATGLHRFSFDQAALTSSFSRIVFPDVAAYLSAYGLSAGSDGDLDGINNEDEFAANTDPTNIDSDGDGLNDLEDPQPLLATRDIVFQVDMRIQILDGTFNPGTDQAKVLFFSGLASPSPGELVLSDPDGDGIHSGTLPDLPGPTGTFFGEYKFFNTAVGAPNNGYEFIPLNRSFIIETANVEQILPVVFFGNDATTVAYDDWAEQFDPNPGQPAQNYDGDAFTNHQEFLFGTSPIERSIALSETEYSPTQLVIRWLERSGGSNYQLLETTTLAQASWTPSPVSPVTDTGGGSPPLGYVRKMATIPVNSTIKFVRVAASE